MIEYLQYDYIQRAFMASVVVGITCGMLGVFVTLRRMALIGDALSHSVLPGVVLAYYFFGYDSLSLFLGAVLAGLSTSFLITFIQRNSPTKDDSSVGIVFTAMFSLGIVGISWLTKRQGVHLDMKDFLFGNVLGVTQQDLWLTFIIGIFVCFSIIAFYKYFFVSTFDPTIADTMGISTTLLHYFLMFLLSISIVSSLQSVGVILVVSMLIIPASTAFLLTNNLAVMLAISAFFGAFSAFSGMTASIIIDTTPGPLMTIVGAIIFIVVLFVSPEKGILSKFFKRKMKKFTIKSEDVIKFLLKSHNGGEKGATFNEIQKKLNINAIEANMLLTWLKYQKMIASSKGNYLLTNRSERVAARIVRSHRLWETFMSKKLNVPDDKLHDSAEKMEHILEEKFWDKIADDLGNPETDPHGSPIPKLETPLFDELALPLFQANIHSEYVVTSSQKNIDYLWQIGLVPNSRMVVLDKNTQFIKVWHFDKVLEIPVDVSKDLNVKPI